MKGNSLQAVMDRQKAAQEPPPVAAPPTVNMTPTNDATRPAKFTRPVREGKKFVGGHFPPEIAKQLRLLAAEEDTTTQALLEQALDLLFVQKGKGVLKRG